MPGIKDVQIVGVPNEKYGEVVGAFVMRSKGSDISEEDVREFAQTRIARYKCPRHVWFVEEFPMTASNKIQKYKLREMAAELMGVSDVKVFASEAAAKLGADA
jgi:fatty-acyl-CoA synthase